VIRNVTGDTLRAAISEQVEIGATTLVTDEWVGYKPLAQDLKGHETVTHSHEQYMNERGFTTNQAEGYFGQLKRSIDGTHHKVSTTHLDRYLTQFAWLYTNCKASDSVRMHTLIDNVAGRRLTYRPLGAR
jgi:hypothetical protein